MKRTAILAVLILAVYAFGQSYGSLSFGPIAPTLASCPPGISGMTTQCTVATGSSYAIWASFNAGAYVQIYPPPTQAVGVVSVNGKTGVVTLALQ